MEPDSTGSIDRWSLAAGALLLTVGGYLAASQPVQAPEAYAFAHFVRWPIRDLLGGFDPAASPLSVILMKRSVGLLGLSTFSLKLPELLGLGSFLWAVAKLSGRWWPVVCLAGIGYLVLECLAPGRALGLGVALWLCGVQRGVQYLQQAHKDARYYLNQAGVCLGLGVAANFCLVIPSLAAAGIIGVMARRKGLPALVWVERLAVTATITAFLLLVLPFSHATPSELRSKMMPPALSVEPPPPGLPAVLATLERKARGKPVRIAAPAAVVPLLEFYRARNRDGDWRIFPDPAQADYYVTNTGRGLEVRNP